MFFDISNGTRVKFETNTTKLSITSLQPDVNCTAFIVAYIYGGDLPSECINTAISEGNPKCYFCSH